jgi:hypothetical protein
MFYNITDRESYLKARAHWRLNYAALSENQRNVKAEISNNQRTCPKKEVFSYDWPPEKQQAWLAAYGQDGAFRSIHGALAYQKKQNAARATHQLALRRAISRTAQANYETTHAPTPTPS